jgi:IPT/TIG domain-containing protein
MANDDAKKKKIEAQKLIGPGKRPMGPWAIVGLSVYTVALMVVIVWILVSLWPPLRPKEVHDRLVKEAPSPSPTPTPTPTPTPPVGGGGTRRARTRATPTPRPSPTPTPTATTSVTPTPSPTATVTAPIECKERVKVKEGFCLDENNKPITGVGAVEVFGMCRCIYDEDRLLLIVLLAGALGACVHSLRSLSWYIGSRRLFWSWSAMYFMLPFLGGGIASIFYLVIRGGFFSPTSKVEDMSPYGFAALAAIVGMFTEQAILKLKKVGGAILDPTPPGKDHVDPPPKITGIGPKQGQAGEKVTITGQAFSANAKVAFDGIDAEITEATETLIVVTSPTHAPGKVDVAVINDDGQQAVCEKGFEYLDSGGVNPPAGGSLSIGSLSPGSGSSGGQEMVAITGTGFSVTPPSSVTFGDVNAEVHSIPDQTTIIVKTPQHAAGKVDITVTNPDGTTTVLKEGYTFD